MLIATVKTYNPANVSAFMNSTNIMSHELFEALNDPLGGREELGDMCDGSAGSRMSAPAFQYMGKWFLEQYWSDQANTCVQGTLP